MAELINQLRDAAGAIVNVKGVHGGGEAVVNTGAAAVELLAAVAGKRIFVKSWRVTNITPGEYPVCVLQDDTAAPIKHAHMAPGAPTAAAKGSQSYDFNPPLEFASGKAVGYALQTATGDCHSDVEAYVEV